MEWHVRNSFITILAFHYVAATHYTDNSDIICYTAVYMIDVISTTDEFCLSHHTKEFSILLV